MDDYPTDRFVTDLLMKLPIPVVIFKGSENKIDFANLSMLDTILKNRNPNLKDKTLVEAFPEMKTQQFPAILNDVFTTGKRRSEKESLVFLQLNSTLEKFYFDIDYAPLCGSSGVVSGVMVILTDVTDKVNARINAEVEKERTALAIEIAEIATWELNLESHEMVHSSNLATIFGHDQSAKMSYTQVINQIDANDLGNVADPAFEIAMKTGTFSYEVRIHKKVGQLTWIRSNGKIFFDQNGEAVKIIGAIIDITNERNSRQTLMESEFKFRLLADSLPQKIWTAEPNGYINYYNNSIYDAIGFSKKQMESGGLLPIIHPDDRQRFHDAWSSAISHGNDLLLEHRYISNNGDARWHLTQALPQRDISGKIQMWVSTSTDIQNQKASTEELEKLVENRTLELQEKNDTLVKLNIELQSFATISSHDLQEPVRKIQMFISRILEDKNEHLSENASTMLSRIHASSQKMQTLIKDLIAYSSTNNSENVLVKLDLNEIVREVLHDYAELIEEKKAQIQVDSLCNMSVIPFQMRQLFSNLVGNALKFTRASIKPVIAISSSFISGKDVSDAVTPEKEYCKISICDNGIGIEDQYKDRIFNIFQRLHDNSVYKGTGIGLAIVKKIVENHKGTIGVSSVINKGTTFNIFIPIE